MTSIAVFIQSKAKKQFAESKNIAIEKSVSLIEETTQEESIMEVQPPSPSLSKSKSEGDSFIVFSGNPKLAPLPALSNSEFHCLSLWNIPANSRTCCPSSNPYLSISLVSSHTSLIWMGRWSLSSHPLTAVWFKEKRRPTQQQKVRSRRSVYAPSEGSGDGSRNNATAEDQDGHE
ncbi:hypothetical protein NE237_030766 [Protea cynaroides]|uniref:Uncharacterized protein n=1 Tax=Protea cynaroides TaxID=273540 RepID=A0A9Q0GYI2_9MAGN|nr:hypothetical protein NE237_030766 [Protea cynaroides]